MMRALIFDFDGFILDTVARDLLRALLLFDLINIGKIRIDDSLDIFEHCDYLGLSSDDL